MITSLLSEKGSTIREEKLTTGATCCKAGCESLTLRMVFGELQGWEVASQVGQV